MNYKLELHSIAEGELWDAVDYYDSQKHRLGKEFAKALQETMQVLKSNPSLFPRIYKRLRKATIKRFPYIIIYEIIENTIFVIAIFHTRRNPEIWKDRT